MSMEFGWWHKDPEQGKFQIVANVHGGNITWERKSAKHHTSWEAHTPTEEDWDKLLYEAGKRVPRRLLSPKQFEVIRQLRPL
jgi:hypothetical protein